MRCLLPRGSLSQWEWRGVAAERAAPPGRVVGGAISAHRQPPRFLRCPTCLWGGPGVLRVSCPETPVPEVDEVTAWMLPKSVGEFTGVESVLTPLLAVREPKMCLWVLLMGESSMPGFCGTGLESAAGPCLRDFCAECMRKFILEIFEQAWGFWFSYLPPTPLFSTPTCFQPADIALSLPPRPVI